MKLTLRGHDTWWWLRLAAIIAGVIAADQVYFHFVASPRTWAGWITYDALGVVIATAGGLFAGVPVEIWRRAAVRSY